jgi:hypothetical protein
VPLTKTIASALVGFQNRDHLAHYYPIYADGEHANVSDGTFEKGVSNRWLDVYCNHTICVKVVYNV